MGSVEVAMSQPGPHCCHLGKWDLGLGGQRVGGDGFHGLADLDEPHSHGVEHGPVMEVATSKMPQK